MKHLPLAALSLVSALGLSAGTVLAQEAETAPEFETQQSELPEAGADVAGGESLEQWEPDRLLDLGGETLMNSQGDSLGEIQEFVRSTDDDQIYAVISSEDPLEIDEMTTVAISDLRWQEQDETVVYSGDEQELERMFGEQPYEEARYQPLDESAEQVGATAPAEDDQV